MAPDPLTLIEKFTADGSELHLSHTETSGRLLLAVNTSESVFLEMEEAAELAVTILRGIASRIPNANLAAHAARTIDYGDQMMTRFLDLPPDIQGVRS